MLVEAERLYREVLRLDPGRLGALNNLGNVLQSLERLTEAENCYREVLAREPRAPEALYNLGATLGKLGREDEARARYEELLAVLRAEGDALAREGSHAEAAECYRRALTLRPDDAALLNQLGVVLDAQGLLTEALAPLQRALEIAPGDADVAYNLGIVLQALGRYDEAIANYERVLQAEPDRGEASLAKALSRLTAGDFERGWREYECRYNARFERPRVVRPDLAFPMWQGEPLAGRRLLVIGEQGYGDQIQFVRYVAQLARQGAEVDVAADARLHRLIATAPGVRRVVQGVARGADYDFWSLMLSLPLRMGTRLDSVPADIPYLRPAPEDVGKWAERLRALPQGRMKVGLVWNAGNTSRERAQGRSMGFEALQPLSRVPGVSFVGIEYGESPPAGELPVLQLGAEVGDFADQAALLMNLDLLVTVDTAAAHLAGAIGVPAWVLLPASPDWRWMWGRADSPWYPNKTRLLRQAQMGDWASVVERAAQELSALAARPR